MEMLPYIGKSEYCYANSIAMVLKGLGEDMDPGMIEVMTGMGVGVTWDQSAGMLFFSCSSPDVGITRALTQLGFEFEEIIKDDPGLDPIPSLIERLNTGPVLLGPLDLGLLPYNPVTRGDGGADHFVVAYGAANGAVYLHDPWGFPCIPLPFAALRSAWQADAIPYRRGYFQSWAVLQRKEWPDLNQLVDRALTLFDTIYQSARAEAAVTGPEALGRVGALIDSHELTDHARNFLTHFSVPLACRRALDMAQFLKRVHPEMTGIKIHQARLLGQTQAELMGSGGSASRCLSEYAECEADFEALVTDSR